MYRGGSRTAATSKMECFVIIVKGAVNYYHKALYLGRCSSPRSVSGCMGWYPKISGKDFLLWLFAVIFNEAKVLPLKMGLPSLGLYYVSVSSCKDCYPIIIGKDFFSLVLLTTTGRVFRILQVGVSRCTGCYPTTIGKDFLLWLFVRSPPMWQKCSHLKCISQV